MAGVVYNFGRADQVDGEKLRRLAKSILRVFSTEPLVEGAEGGDVRIRDQLALRRGVRARSALAGAGHRPGAAEPERVFKRTATPSLRALFAMVANRCLSLSSKLAHAAQEQWLREEVFLPSAEGLDLHHLYFAMDLPGAAQAGGREVGLLRDGRPDERRRGRGLLRHDLAALRGRRRGRASAGAFTRLGRYQPLRKQGHSKNGRGDAPQIVIGLAITREGLPTCAPGSSRARRAT